MIDHAAFELIINQIIETSVERCKKWHGEKGIDDWSVLEWAGATCGEAGELANVAKKILRIEHGMQSIGDAGLTKDNLEALDRKYAQECADVFLYLVLNAAKRKVNLAKAIIDTFNNKSEEYGFFQRL